MLREWGGLWEGTDERYRVGQRLLMLLHAPGASGLSSPVSGMDGAIPLLAGASATAEPMVDLRWVAARVSRGPVRYRAETPRTPARPGDGGGAAFTGIGDRGRGCADGVSAGVVDSGGVCVGQCVP